MTASLCGTQKSPNHGSVFNVGVVCQQYSLIQMGGIEMKLMPHYPPMTDDVDPDILDSKRQATESLTRNEFNEWVNQSGNPYQSGKTRIKNKFTEDKIQKWFENKGDSVRCKVSPTPITFEIFRGCAIEHPPSRAEIPGIKVETARYHCFVLVAYIWSTE